MRVTISSTLDEKVRSVAGVMLNSFVSAGVARRGVAGRPVENRPVGGSQGLVPRSEIYAGGPSAGMSNRSGGTLLLGSSLDGKPGRMFNGNETTRMDDVRTYML